ncbi:MAG TPA: hypothetical protein VMU83_09565 [Hanamia sp.]|nr:hypothetical protein [Hanamia sp.]
MVNSLLLILISIHILFLLLHFAVLIKIIPRKIVWGGRLTTDKEMFSFEIVSLLITTLFTIILLLKENYLSNPLPPEIINICLWIMTAIYLFNSIGNFVSKNKLEKYIFGPIAIGMFVLLLIVLLSK